jgi:hypothetical protein
MTILSGLHKTACPDASNARRKRCKKRLAPGLGLGAVALAALTPIVLASGAKADPIDMTTLPPFYEPEPDVFVPGPVPGFSVTATANLLTVTGEKNLPATSGLTTFNGPFPAFPQTITGDFSATVTSTVSQYAVGGLSAGFGASFAAINFDSGRLYTQGGLDGSAGVIFTHQSTPISAITVQITRSGADLNFNAAIGGDPLQHLFTLTKTTVLEPNVFSFDSGGTVGVDATSTTTYTNFVVQTFAPSSISGVSGGLAAEPEKLPSRTIGSVSGDIGAADESSVYFSFYWQAAGDFAASVGVPDAAAIDDLAPSYLFDLCAGRSCGPAFESVSADKNNGYQNELSWDDLAAGYYTVGIIAEGAAVDPPYSVVFATPVIGGSVSSVPEPTTWTMLIVGFAGVCSFRWLQSSKRSQTCLVGRTTVDTEKNWVWPVGRDRIFVPSSAPRDYGDSLGLRGLR